MEFILTENHLKLNNSIVCCYFYSSYLPFYIQKKMSYMLGIAESQYNDIIFYGIDIQHLSKYIDIFKLVQVPTILILENGREIKRINGLSDTGTVLNIFQSA